MGLVHTRDVQETRRHEPTSVDLLLGRCRGKLKFGIHVDERGASILFRFPEHGDLHDFLEWIGRWEGSPRKQRNVLMLFLRTGFGLRGRNENVCDADVADVPIVEA